MHVLLRFAFVTAYYALSEKWSIFELFFVPTDRNNKNKLRETMCLVAFNSIDCHLGFYSFCGSSTLLCAKLLRRTATRYILADLVRLCLVESLLNSSITSGKEIDINGPAECHWFQMEMTSSFTIRSTTWLRPVITPVFLWKRFRSCRMKQTKWF